MSGLQWLEAPAEIVDSILSELYHSDSRAFGAFRGASRACKSASDYLFYREVRLANYKDYECKRRPWNDAIVDRRPWEEADDWKGRIRETVNVLSTSPVIAHYLRDLAIGPFASEPHPLDEDEILDLLARLPNLTDFRWETNHQIPAKVVQFLRHSLPDCRFHVSLLTRRDVILDETTLSLPSLRSLNIAVLTDYNTKASEWPKLDRALRGSARLEHLTLMTAGEHSVYKSDVRTRFSEICKDLPSTLVGPWTLTAALRGCQLRSLHIGGRVYNEWGIENLIPWISGMDWSQLTFLDLENAADCLSMLKTLTGEVPHLRTLKLGGPDDLYPDDYPQRIPPIADDALRAFLLGTPLLQDVSLFSADNVVGRHFLDVILDCSGHTLRSFSVANSDRVAGRTMYWTAPDVKKLLTKAPALNRIAIELDPLKATNSLVSTCSHDLSALLELSSSVAELEKLETLELLIRLPASACPSSGCFVTDYDLNGLNHEVVKQTLDTIFGAVLTRNPYAPLDQVDLIFKHPDYGKLYWRVRGRRVHDPLPGQEALTMDIRGSPYLSPGSGHGGRTLFDGTFHPEPRGEDWFG